MKIYSTKSTTKLYYYVSNTCLNPDFILSVLRMRTIWRNGQWEIEYNKTPEEAGLVLVGDKPTKLLDILYSDK